MPAYARVVASAVKVPEGQVVPTVTNARFPASLVVLYPDTASVNPAPLADSLPESEVTATVTEWRPGVMRITLDGSSAQPSYLVVSENWYPDWKAEVDGRPAAVLRGDHSLLSLVLPAGAREVSLRFDSRSYSTGKLVSLIALAAM